MSIYQALVIIIDSFKEYTIYFEQHKQYPDILGPVFVNLDISSFLKSHHLNLDEQLLAEINKEFRSRYIGDIKHMVQDIPNRQIFDLGFMQDQLSQLELIMLHVLLDSEIEPDEFLKIYKDPRFQEQFASGGYEIPDVNVIFDYLLDHRDSRILSLLDDYYDDFFVDADLDHDVSRRFLDHYFELYSKAQGIEIESIIFFLLYNIADEVYIKKFYPYIKRSYNRLPLLAPVKQCNILAEFLLAEQDNEITQEIKQKMVANRCT